VGYTPPVYSLRNQTSTTPNGGNVIDIGDIDQPLMPPVMHGEITATATVQVQGSHDSTSWIDYSGGGFTTSFARDLVMGVRFCRATVTSYGSGTITCAVGAVPTKSGQPITPHLITVENNATFGQ
jgi:hypothetical protein